MPRYFTKLSAWQRILKTFALLPTKNDPSDMPLYPYVNLVTDVRPYGQQTLMESGAGHVAGDADLVCPANKRRTLLFVDMHPVVAGFVTRALLISSTIPGATGYLIENGLHKNYAAGVAARWDGEIPWEPGDTLRLTGDTDTFSYSVYYLQEDA